MVEFFYPCFYHLPSPKSVNTENRMNYLTRSFICLIAATLTFATRAEQIKFSVAPNFFDETPNDQQLGPCHGGAVIDQAGNIYVSTDTPRGIIVYTPDGKYLRAFGPSHIHAMELRDEDGAEFIYAARPSNHEVTKIDLNGKSIWTIHYPKESGLFKDEKGFNPCAVTVGPDGSIYVADGYGSNYILKFDKDRKFVKAFGGPGKELGKFNTCHGIALDTRHEKPLLFVCDRNNNRIEYWDLDGNFVKVIQKDLRMPAAVHIRGDYVLIPELQGRATLLDKDNNIVAQVGDNPNEKQRANYGLPRDQWKVGICNSPHGGSIDKDGNLIITEWSQFGNLHKFVRQK
jgi:sugar lactone lactonase YvrE